MPWGREAEPPAHYTATRVVAVPPLHLIVGRRSTPLPSVGPGWRGGRVRFGNRHVVFEQYLRAVAIEIPDLEFPAPRGDQQVSVSIPVRPLEVIQQVDLSLHFQPVGDTQAVYRLIDAELAASPPEAFHTQQTVAARLAFLEAGVAALIPCVPRVALGRVRAFLPAATSFVRKLNHRNRAHSIGDRERRILRIRAVRILGEVVAARPSATRAEDVERGEPGELRQGYVRLAVFPSGAGLVRKVAEGRKRPSGERSDRRGKIRPASHAPGSYRLVSRSQRPT